MDRFFVTRNADSDEMYCQALASSGFVEVSSPETADFILHDAVHPGVESFIRTKPTFIFPHTPQSSFLWDGILGIDPVCCNFVAGEAGIKTMKAYGYPYRVEAVGFSRCEVREFTPTAGNDLLVVPSHPLQHGEYTLAGYMGWVENVLRFILHHRSEFGKITLCWSEKKIDPMLVEEMGKSGVVIIPTDPYKDSEPLKNMMGRMEKSDLVLSCGTVGCVSVAMGRPTVFFSEFGNPRSNPRDALHPDLYVGFLRFPLQAEQMSIDKILEVRTKKNTRVEYWKEQNIGGPFNAKKFISVIREYVK
jgi:hypothetical protein